MILEKIEEAISKFYLENIIDVELSESDWNVFLKEIEPLYTVKDIRDLTVQVNGVQARFSKSVSSVSHIATRNVWTRNGLKMELVSSGRMINLNEMREYGKKQEAVIIKNSDDLKILSRIKLK